MINIATVHWKSRVFQDIQYKNISKNINDFRIWAFVDKVSKDNFDSRYFYCADSGIASHLIKLDRLADLICKSSSPSDIIIFMDGDAWPVLPINDFIKESLRKFPLGAVIRKENYENYPHPCFMFTTVGYWLKTGISWSKGIKYSGDGMLHILNLRKENWTKLFRTKGLAEHPVFFSFYANMIYHHGAGFRNPISKYCIKTENVNPTLYKNQSINILNYLKKILKNTKKYL